MTWMWGGETIRNDVCVVLLRKIVESIRRPHSLHVFVNLIVIKKQKNLHADHESTPFPPGVSYPGTKTAPATIGGMFTFKPHVNESSKKLLATVSGNFIYNKSFFSFFFYL